MPAWLHKKLKEGGARNPHAIMNAAGIGKRDSHEEVSKKMSSFMKAKRFMRKHKKRKEEK